jgi:streptogramin lyase
MLGVGMLCACSSAAATTEGTIAEFSIPTVEAKPVSIAPGPDGNLWFTEHEGNKIGRITPSGSISEFSLPASASSLEGIAPGPDGNVWFTEHKGDTVGRITPSGAFAEFSIPTVRGGPEDIATGPEGNLWFTEFDKDRIGRITPSGAITEFPLPAGETGPWHIALGSDGNLWFTELEGGKIGRITPGGAITEFPIPTTNSGPDDIAPGPDGNLWFTEIGANKIGRITPSGTITEFPVPTADSGPSNIAPGPDGNLWFTEQGKDKIGRITPTGTIGEFQLPVAESQPTGIAPGADGNMWFVESKTNKIGQIGTGAPAASVAPPTVTGNAQPGTAQTCDATWATWDAPQPSATMFGFDGYSWRLSGAEVATGQSYTPNPEAIGHTLTCAETVTYPLLDVTASATSAAVSVVAPPPPAITAVHQSATTWREGGRLAQISRATTHTGRAKGRRLPPLGTTFSFVLSEEASVSLSFAQHLSGHRVGGKCLAKNPRDTKGKRCTRTTAAGTISFKGHSGTNKVVFQGRVSRAKRLAPGRYTLTILATDSEEARSAPESLSFTIGG